MVGFAVIACGVVPVSAHQAIEMSASPARHQQPKPAAPTQSERPERVSRATRAVPRPAPRYSADELRLAAQTDIPIRALVAYRAAAAAQQHAQPGCGIQWEFIAAFGRIETDHGRLNGSNIGSDGIDRPALLGPPLDGSEPGVIGALSDSSGRAVRAAGPLQFIPDTWQRWGHGDMQSIDAAAATAARYLCADGHDLATGDGRWSAALSYNDVDWYATDVVAIYNDYLTGQPAHSFPAAPGSDTGTSANPASVQSPVDLSPSQPAVAISSAAPAPSRSATPSAAPSTAAAPSSPAPVVPTALPTPSAH